MKLVNRYLFMLIALNGLVDFQKILFTLLLLTLLMVSKNMILINLKSDLMEMEVFGESPLLLTVVFALPYQDLRR